MERILIDFSGKKIFSGMIVKLESIENSIDLYYLYKGLSESKGILYRYDKKGNLNTKQSYNNIYLDAGVKLVNNNKKRWVCIGPAESYHKKIFTQ